MVLCKEQGQAEAGAKARISCKDFSRGKVQIQCLHMYIGNKVHLRWVLCDHKYVDVCLPEFWILFSNNKINIDM